MLRAKLYPEVRVPRSFHGKDTGTEVKGRACTGRASSFKAKQIRPDLLHRPQQPGPIPPPGDRPNSGIEPTSPALQADSLLLSHQGSLEGLLRGFV